MLRQRKELDPKEVERLSNIIINKLIQSKEFKKANTIMTYVSYPNEAQTDSLIHQVISMGKTMAVPICDKSTVNLIPSKLTDLGQLETGYFGLREPKKEYFQPVDKKNIDMIIIPGVAFDKSGNRIGHGKGYYDNFFKDIPKTTPKIALAFQYQIIDDEWEIDDWDIKMDGILTENGYIFKDF